MFSLASRFLSNRMSYFFDSGVRFQCQQCGQCCRGEPGTIYVSDPEVKDIAVYLGLKRMDFTRRFLRPFQDSYTILERDNGDCLLYANGCSVYPVRPRQCRTFPFWRQTMRSQWEWKQVAATCPGIGQGPLYSREQILSILETSRL